MQTLRPHSHGTARGSQMAHAKKEHIIVNYVHTPCKQGERAWKQICTQICFYALCECGLSETNDINEPLKCFANQEQFQTKILEQNECQALRCSVFFSCRELVRFTRLSVKRPCSAHNPACGTQHEVLITLTKRCHALMWMESCNANKH